MIFEEDRFIEKVGEKIGYLFSYLLFTTILYLILLFLKNDGVSYFFVMLITITIAIIGIILNKSLK